MENNQLPKTTGQWFAIYRNKKDPQIVAWIEKFDAGEGRWVAIPGASRIVSA